MTGDSKVLCLHFCLTFLSYYESMSKLKNPTVGVCQNMQEWSGGDLLTLVVVAT